MYRDHFGTIPVAVSGNAPQPAPKYPPYGDQPKTSSGSPTYPLDMMAALTPDHKYLSLAVVNGTESPQHFDLNVTGTRLGGEFTLWQLTGTDLDAQNRVGQQPQVAVKQTGGGSVPQGLTAAPISVSIYRFAVDTSAS